MTSPLSLSGVERVRGAYRAAFDAAVERVLASGRFILGPEVEAFETAFAADCGVDHCVAVGNGTDALTIALEAAGIGPGDVVLSVSHTAGATIAAILLAGARPLLVDIDPRTLTIEPEAARAALTQAAAGPPRHRVKAIVAVHLYGRPCALDALAHLARDFGIPLIEDAAQAHGARVGAARVGSLGRAAAFSFYPTKTLGAFGDGGAITTQDPALAARARALRQYGWTIPQDSAGPGRNSRLDEIQAALLRVRLGHLDAEIARRRNLAERYDRDLAPGLIRSPTGPGAAPHLYVVRTPARAALIDHLAARGIATGIHYPKPVHRQTGFRDRVLIGPGGLAETERAAAEVVSLPLHAFLKDDEVARVIAEANAARHT